MREVSQNWIENQDKTLRDQGLLRLDFLSAHNNNAKANIIPMGSDSSKSNINEIKDIAPYGAPNKNLAMPNLTGKPEISAGVYRLYDWNGITIDYNVTNGQFVINGTQTSDVLVNIAPIITETGESYTSSYLYVSGTGSLTINWLSPNQNLNPAALSSVNNEVTVVSQGQTMIRFYSSQIGRVFDNLTFKLQLEKGDTATDYEIPQPNTGYVSTNPSGTNGEVATNLAMPDLSTATDLGGGNYRIYNANGITIDYNVNTGIWTFNGVPTLTIGRVLFNIEQNTEYTLSYIAVSGTLSGGLLNIAIEAPYSVRINQNNQNVNKQNTFTTTTQDKFRFDIAVGTNFNNFQFKLQLEKGSTASDYQLPNYVPIEVNVEDYRSPLNGLTITWSENFGYAVDYSIEYNGEIYTYLNNTKKTVFVPIIVENTPDANFKIRVHKWSQGGLPIRIERVFVGLHLIYKQDKIFSFNKKKYNNVLGLELPQDQINFELSNLDRMFDPLWYNSYFKYLNEKTEIRAYSGFKYGTNGEEWIKQGTYYLTDWKAPNNSITATFTARDILNLLDADEMYSKDTPLTLDEYCDIILGRDYKGVDDYVPYDLPVNPDGSKKWNIRKNLAMPDFIVATDLGDGNYRLYDDNGVTVDYNVNSGIRTVNGTWTGTTGQPAEIFLSSVTGLTLTVSVEIVSGVLPAGVYYRPSGLLAHQIPTFEGVSYQVPYIRNSNYIRMVNGAEFNNFQYRVQLEKGDTATPYELPIENANIPVLKETVNKREALQLIAQSIGCHIKVDDNGNISFIRETYGKQIDVPNKILLTKPEFNLSAPVKKIIVPYSKYNPDPNELEVAKIDVSAGDIVEINHDTPYFNGHGTHTTGSATLQSTDMTWYRSFKAVIGGTGTGQLIVMREPVIKSSVNVIQDISSSGDTLTYENNLIDTQLKASRAIGRIWGEIDNSREVEFELRIDPRIDTFNVVSFPFRVLNLEQVEYMRVDELELTYNGAYKGKVKGVILSNYGGDLTAKTYTKKADEFASGEENLKWHLLNE